MTLWMRVAILASLCVVLAGCSSPSRKPCVPDEQQNAAVIPGMGPEVRTWAAVASPEFVKPLMQSVVWEREALAAAGHAGALPPAEFLAISGGGQNGAYGAGMLCAWSELPGGRPKFKAVTGVSTGALTAPFVFAGPEYDHVLREVYTKTDTSKIAIPRWVLAAVYDDAMADTSPLFKLVSQYVDEKLLAAIAAEHRKGRVLLVGTTNLDARRAVIWNVGAIAASGSPNAVDVVRKILLASAAIPAAFPPVMIDVEVDGKKYQELHVDGGAMTQVFLYPPSMKLKAETAAAGIERERRLYIIRNSRLDADYAEVERNTMTIAARAIDSMINTQGIGDLYRIYLNAQRDDIDFNLAFIPPTFRVKAKEGFDPEYMTQLFQVGYDRMKAGYPWQKTPPGYEGMPAGMFEAPAAPAGGDVKAK